MKKPQLFVLSIGIIALAALYFLPNIIPPIKKPDAQANHKHDVEKLDFEQVKAKSIEKLSINNATIINQYEGKTDKESLLALSEAWAKAKNGSMSAKYKADLAKLENSEKSLTFASQYFIDLYNIEQDTALKVWQASQAVELLQQVVKANPTNEKAKVALGMCYTDGTGETMKGVLMLREITEQNPKQLDAGVTLGKLAIQSGQFDKAVARLGKLHMLYSKNTEVLYFLAEAHKGNGDIPKAKELFNECKLLVKSPEFAKEIDEYIKTF